MTKHSYGVTLAIDQLPDSALDQLLENFYAEERSKNGKKYSVQSLRSIRAGIQRYYSEPPRRRNNNIISGENCGKSKEMFEAVCMDLKRSGLGDVTHKPVINEDDMIKIGKYVEAWQTNLLVLVRKVWFDLMIFCCRRGREGLRELTKESYVVDMDGAGTKCIRKNGSEVTKNHRNDIEDSTGGIVYEEKGSEMCPIKSFSFYVEKLNPNLNALFQLLKSKFNFNDEVWFENKPLEKNSLGDMMINISKASGLSKAFTNHSIRSTSFTSLSDSGFEDRKIKTVSKNKSPLQSIENYTSDTSLPQKKKMSEALAGTDYDIKRSDQLISNAVAIPQTKSVCNVQFVPAETSSSMDLAAIDFLDDAIMLDPELDRILTEVSSCQYNVSNKINRESTCNKSINNHVSGGVFNFYVTK